jgi:hypothetical protein
MYGQYFPPKGGEAMTIYQSLSLMIAFASVNRFNTKAKEQVAYP